MRILIVGKWAWPWYEEACADALMSLGHDVRRFSWRQKFKYFQNDDIETRYMSKWAELQNRLLLGPAVSALNSELISTMRRFQPDIFFGYRATHILPRTLKKIKKAFPRLVLIQYCNDDPFSPRANPILWRHLKRAIPLYDIHFVYRHHNKVDLRRYGAKRVELLRSYYVAERNYPVQIGPDDRRFVCDVVFVGHYESDFRLKYLETIAAAGYKLNLFGGGWAKARKLLKPESPLRGLYPIVHLDGAKYRKALCGAKVALSFLSKINRDTYTRRNFEIPAACVFMLSEYSDDLATLFEEGKEIEFFRSKEEMMEKIEYYLNHDAKRMEIAKQGYERVVRDGHDVVSRMGAMIKRCEVHIEEKDYMVGRC